MEYIEVDFGRKLKTNEAGAAVEELFRTYYQPLCNYAFFFLKDIDESEEIVQGIFYNMWEKRASTEINTSVKSYLYTSVRNNCLNRIKHLKIRNKHRESVIISSERSSDNAMHRIISKELEVQIKSAIDGLPEQCGLIFKLSRHGDLKYAEIADHLDISVKTVENQMGKALKILREKLKSYLILLIFILINSLN
jgi:RNA polymerase sigma-70 factor (ECF subfamily)